MKKIIYSLLVCLAFIFVSCEDDTTQDISKITYFVNFEMKGDATTLVEVGTQYVEPGVIAMEGETDITASMKTSGTVDVSKVGVYTLNYSAVNVDGFSKSIQRMVVVYNPAVTTDLGGSYNTAEGSYRFWIATGKIVPCVGNNVKIERVAPGVFSVSDFMGGYYAETPNKYGSAYAMKGYMKLNIDNTIDVLSGHVPAWNDSYDAFEKGKYDPITGNLYWEMTYGGKAMIFFVTLTK